MRSKCLMELLGIPGAYFNAMLFCFFVALFQEDRPTLNLVKSLKAFWPALKATLVGFLPAAVIASTILWFFPSLPDRYQVTVMLLGVFVSAVVLHRFLLNKFEKWVAFHLSAAALIALQVGLTAVLF